MSAVNRIVVVGASLAGLRGVEALRAEGFDGELCLIGAEPHLPYDRPPLSKEILRGQWTDEQLGLRRDPYEALQVELRTGRRVESLDVGSRSLTVDDGERVTFDSLLIATGAAARRVRAFEGLDGVHYLRTKDDAQAIRRDLLAAKRVVVVGAGFIGAEVAASCRQLGLEVVLVEPQPVPLLRGLGRELGEVSAKLHREHGVDLRCGVSVAAIDGDTHVETVTLDDGSIINCDVVVVGVGAVPVTGWLESSGLELDDGVVCDRYCETSVPGIYAAGDVARWHNALFDETMRVEHWTNAVEQGVYAARRMLGKIEEPFAPVPTFWSDQYDVKIQFAGRMSADDRIEIVRGDPDEYKFVALFGRADRLVGVLTFRWPRHLIRYSQMIADGVSFEDALAAG
jgi:NADPH-dependent 2,4-dienoyl-CoA reductase/sulfur reductase-like enzyme